MEYITEILKNESIISARTKSHEEMFAFFIKIDGDKKTIIGSRFLSKGTIGSVSVSEEVFNSVIDTCKELKANGLVLLHNHPKSLLNLVLKPSDNDLDFTVMFYCLAKGHKVQLLDHLIVDHGSRYYSFKENELI